MRKYTLSVAVPTEINTYQVLQTVSLLYIAFPTILFLAGWLRLYISIPVILITLFGIYSSLKTAWDFNPGGKFIQLKDFRKIIKLNYFVIILLVIFMVTCSGLGGFAIQDGDYFKHNAFYNDLVKYRWPLAYDQTGPDDAPRILNTYVGYYLPSALVGKIFGWSAGYFFSFIWACIGLFLSILWILQFVRGWPILFAAMFLFFGGLDFFGWQFFVKSNHFGIDYNYSSWMMFFSGGDGLEFLSGVFWILGSNQTTIANAPHHIFPSWVCIMMLFHDAVKRESNDRTLFVASFLPFISAFLSVGTLPFVILSLFQNKLNKCLTWPNLLVGIPLVSIAGLYLISNDAEFLRGWVWNFTDLTKAYPFLLIFYLTGFGTYFLVMPKHLLNEKEMYWLTGTILCFLIFPLYRIGAAMDFPLKAFNPSWIIFQTCLFIVINRIFRDSQSTKSDKIRGHFLIGLVCIGSIAAFSNITVAVKSGLFKGHVSRNGILPINAYKTAESLQLFSTGESFFWKYLSKRIVYDQSTSRETFTDKFGNTFKLDFIKCNERQGFYILVNGTQKGCCLKMIKNKDGLVQALDGFGDSWIYDGEGWVAGDTVKKHQ